MDRISWPRRTLSVAFGFLLVLVASPSLAGGLAILETVLSDNGDNDGFADTNETVSMRLRVQNTTGTALQNVSVTLRGQQSHLSCLTADMIQIGNLAPAEVRLSTEAFVFKVSASADRTALALSPFDNLSATFDVVVASQPEHQEAHPPELSLDLDLDASGGAGPTTFFESFENGMGAFEVQNLDQTLVGQAASDGYRCQYNDPDGPYPYSPCHLGLVPGQSEAVFWGLSGPDFSPEGGRGFSGFNSLFFGIDLSSPRNWTTPVSVLEAARTAQPIRLAAGGATPVLSIKHQVSFVDKRIYPPLPSGMAYDRAVVMAQVADEQGNPAGPWFKIYPYQNAYDQTAYISLSCNFDPTDDGSTEDDFYDPTDPDRLFGPSSTCFPGPIFADIGETSNAFAPANVGRSEGPGLHGLWGIGTWIESKFDLGRFRGRQIRIRFLSSMTDGVGFTDWEDIFQWNPHPGDDGWWIDDVSVTGALTTPATVAVDTHDNSGLPSGLPDGDADGIHDSCDNCAAQANAEQYDRDFDGVGNVCDPCITEPTNLDDDSDTICNLEDNCPSTPNSDQLDGDDDAFGAVCDCNDANAATHPGATEINDGEDNQCAGEPGYGAEDEISGSLAFRNPANENELSWTAQPGATKYQVARATARNFTTGCTTFVVNPPPLLNDPAQPAPGVVFYYLVRSVAPNPGSWGLRSDGTPRTVPCN